MIQKIDDMMLELNSDYSAGRLNGILVIKAIKGGNIKYRFSQFVASHPAHFIGYMTAMCSELAKILIGNHN